MNSNSEFCTYITTPKVQNPFMEDLGKKLSSGPAKNNLLLKRQPTHKITNNQPLYQAPMMHQKGQMKANHSLQEHVQVNLSESNQRHVEPSSDKRRNGCQSNVSTKHHVEQARYTDRVVSKTINSQSTQGTLIDTSVSQAVGLSGSIVILIVTVLVSRIKIKGNYIYHPL